MYRITESLIWVTCYYLVVLACLCNTAPPTKAIESNKHVQDSRPSVNNLNNEINIYKNDVRTTEEPRPHVFTDPIISNAKDQQHSKQVHNNKKQHINATDPSTGYLEQQIQDGATKIEDLSKKQLKIEPSLETIEKTLLNVNVANNSASQQNASILPGYEGFQGASVNGNEIYRFFNGDENKTSLTHDVADLDDYKKWLDKQDKISRLSRFRALQLELNKNAHRSNYRDDLFDENFFLSSSENADQSMTLEQKLAKAIQEMEDMEKMLKKKRKVDL